jgi:hypothetical protein
MKKLTNKQVLILVGHGAYSGDNGPRLCFSKAQAVRVLRNRGYFRNQARAAVNKAIAKDNGYTTVSNLTSVTEVRNEKYFFEQGYYHVSYEEIKKYWSDKPEA